MPGTFYGARAPERLAARLAILLGGTRCSPGAVRGLGAADARRVGLAEHCRPTSSHQLALAGPADGAYVYDLTAKQALFSERAATMRPPASVEKLYTATTGARTRIGADGAPEHDRLRRRPARARRRLGRQASTCAAAAIRRSAAAPFIAQPLRRRRRERLDARRRSSSTSTASTASPARSRATSPTSTRCAASPRATTRPTRSSKARSARSPSTAAKAARNAGRTRPPRTPLASCARR